MVKKDIYDVLFWIGMSILILYIIAKVFGIINSPDWLNLLPLISLAFITGIFYQKVMFFMNQMYKRTDFLKRKLDSFENKLNTIGNKLYDHDSRLSFIEKNKTNLNT